MADKGWPFNGDPQAVKALLAGNSPSPLQNAFQNPQYAGGALTDPQFYGDIKDRLAKALSSGVQDVLPTGTRTQKQADRLGMMVDPNYMQKMTDVGLAGMMIGKSAKTWNAADHAKALEMEAKGIDPRIIWKESGNWKGPDGSWRQEIPDNTATGAFTHLKEMGNDRLSDVAVNHPALYSAYPELNGVTQLGLREARPQGSFESMGANSGVLSARAPDERGIANIGIHELQHAIQQREGWAKGGSPDGLPEALSNDAQALRRKARALFDEGKRPEGLALEKRARILDSQTVWGAEAPNELYRRLAGEAEARATQARIPLDAAQRRALLPADSYDVPINKLIIRK